MYFYRSQFEAEPGFEMIKQFHSNSEGLKIVIDNCEIYDGWYYFHLIIVIRQMHVLQSKASYGLIAVRIGNQILTNGNGFTFVKLLVENSSIDYWQMIVYGSKSVGFLKLKNTAIKASVHSLEAGGLVSMDFNNCTFHVSRLGWVVKAESVHQVKIINCKFSLAIYHNKFKCLSPRGCIVSVRGWEFSLTKYKLVNSLFSSCEETECRKLYIKNSEFVGSLGDNGGIINCEDMHLELENCRFSLKENHPISPEGGFIYYHYEGGRFSATNVTFDASAIQSNMLVSIMELRCEEVLFRNTQIMCPNSLGFLGNEHEISYYMILHHYVCQMPCASDEYTYQAGSILFNHVAHKDNHIETSRENKPVCSSCPIGANCSNHIKAFPNYWGYKGKFDVVSMIRCPSDYCCQGDETCKDIDSCNANRTGPLCGRCKGNWTESLLSPKCLLVDDCPAGLILMLYIGGVVAYGLGLMAMSFIKDVGPTMVKNALKVLTKRVLCRKGEGHSDGNEHQESKSLKKECKSKDETNVSDHKDDLEDDDDFMKYVKILFYYIQDAALFKIQLPSLAQQEESIVVKILQFSPEILVMLYSKVSDLCFTPQTTAVTKIWFSSLFGPCVMVFIFILYLSQTCISQLFHKSGKMFRARVVQTFLLVVLFSFQKLVMGAFTLVQCVNIGTKTILYVQGDIECYTWWQRTIEAYIILSIIPTFLVLSHVPFYVQKKGMSVRMFIIGCFLPIPVLAIYHFKKLRKWIQKSSTHNVTVVFKQIETTNSTDNVTVVSEKIEIQRATRSDVDWNKKVDEFFLRMIKHFDFADSDDSCDTSVDILEQRYSISESDTDIGSEYSSDLIKVKRKDSKVSSQAVVSNQETISTELKSEKVKIKYKFNNSREAITYTLLKD